MNEKSTEYRNEIARAIMSVHKNVETVLAQTSSVGGQYRLRRLEHVAGRDNSDTVHRESGCLFSVDVEKCYFSPRLSCERMRIAEQVGDGEVVVNMFAGVGSFSVIIAKHAKVKKIYSIDVNPVAVEHMQRNVRMNRVFGKVVCIVGDAKEVAAKRLRNVADGVLMPLPERALEYLPYALLALKKRSGWIHYYDFEHARKNEDPVEKAKLRVSERLRSFGTVFEVTLGRVVRTTGPCWHQVVLDIKANAGNVGLKCESEPSF